MKKTAFLLISMSTNLMYASAMTCIADKKYTLERCARKRDQFSKKVIPLDQKTIEYKKPFIEPSLSAVLEQQIIAIPGICCTYPSLKDAAMVMSNLVCVNSFFHRSINDSDKTLDLIKKLSQHFRCSDMKVAETLSTSAAYYRGLMQEPLYISPVSQCNLNVQMLNKSRKMGLDVDFTYCSIMHTPLMRAVFSMAYGTREIIDWLITNDADINKRNGDGKNPVIVAIENYKKELIILFLDHPTLDVHHKDIHDNTLLHFCVGTILNCTLFQIEANNVEYDFMITVIEQLLEKGANPTVKNKSGRTPMEFALQESGKERPNIHFPEEPSGHYKNIISQKIIDLLKEAEEDWKDRIIAS